MSESAAIALSQSPQVKLIEQERLLHIQSTQTGAPWDLDSIDEIARTLQGNYIYNATGNGVVAYVLDSDIRATHNDFGGRASNAADFVNESGCTGTNNDCHIYSHGTAVASVVGGSTYGVSKGVTIKSVKICNSSGTCPTGAVTSGPSTG
jgi:subtilisin family serine protease